MYFLIGVATYSMKFFNTSSHSNVIIMEESLGAQFYQQG